MSVTPEQRQQWREDAHHAPIPHHGRILALLDELDASEAEADEWKRAADVNLYRKLAKRAEGERDQARLQMARFPDEKALREQAEAALDRVRALADDLATREGMASSNMRDPDMAADRSYYEGMRDALDLAETDLRAALDGDDR